MSMRTLQSPGKLLLTVLALVALSGLFSLASATEAGTFAKALEQAKAQNKILVIDFYTDW
jgi:hypothetical protein